MQLELTINQWNDASIILAGQLAFSDAGDRVTELIRVETEDNKWSWPRTTFRQSGQVVNSPRDVVDSGAFLNSIEGRLVDLNTYEHHIGVDYALNVVLGERGKPARNVFEAPIERYLDLTVGYASTYLNEV